MKYKRYFLLASVLLLASALFFACKHGTGGADNGGNNNGTKKEQFAVTVAEGSETYVKFQDGYTAGTKKYKGEKVRFKVELPIDKKVVKVTAGTETLTAVGEVYTVTLNADTEVKVETKEAEQFSVKVKWYEERVEFLDGYTAGTKKYKGEKVRFKVKVPADRTLLNVTVGNNPVTPDADGIYTITLDGNKTVEVNFTEEAGVSIDGTIAKKCVEFLDGYIEKKPVPIGTKIRFKVTPPEGKVLVSVNLNLDKDSLKKEGDIYTFELKRKNRIELKFK